MREDFGDGADLLRSAAQGDAEAQSKLLGRYRSPLKKMVRLRLSRRLGGRIDDADVVEDALQAASRRLPEYMANPQPPFFLWLRRIAADMLQEVHQRNLGAQARDAERHQISLLRGALPAADAGALAAQLLGRPIAPSEAAAKAEMRLQLQAALDDLDPLDRELLALRHFEQLSNFEAAHELGLELPAAANRYIRALARLQAVFHKGHPPATAAFDPG